MKYSIVIPMYNSGQWIMKLIDEISVVMDKLDSSYEIILVNDASPDPNTWNYMKEVSDKYKNVKSIDLFFNVGQIRALMCGLEHASGDFVITMDDDFQHDPNEIPNLVHAMAEDPCDCVIAAYKEKKHSIIRRMGSKLVNYISYMLYKKPKDITSNSFRIMTDKLAKAICLYQTNHPQMGPILFTLTKNVHTVQVEHKERRFGKSGYSLKKMISETYKMIISGSTWPLDIVSVIGLITSLISFVIGFIYMLLFMLGRINVPGFTATILVITFFSGLILFSVGITGKYIGRIVEELTGPPKFHIRETYSKKDKGGK